MYTIFGSTGFIGKELTLHLKRNKKKVFLPARNKKKFKKNLGYVIYCVGSDDWHKKTKKGYFSNFGHLQEIIFNNKYKSFIFLSTTRLYINSNKNTEEKNDLFVNTKRTNDYYNILKIASESLLLKLDRKIKIVRLSNVFGFNYNSPLILPTLIRDSIKKSKIKISISLNSSKDYISIQDAMELILKILKKGKHNIYNVANGKNIKIKNIVKIIKNNTKCKVILKNQKKIVIEPKININKIKSEFKFKSKFKIEKDLPKLIDKFKIFYKK